MLDNRYTYGKINLAEEFVTEFEKKIVIITSGGYENSSLEELVNSSWKNEIITKINYESLDPAVKFTKSIKFNSGELREYNKNNLTIVTPNEAKFFTHNYHPNYFFESGCQFVCLNYQKFDKHFDKYITKFRRDSFIPKPKRMSPQQALMRFKAVRKRGKILSQVRRRAALLMKPVLQIKQLATFNVAQKKSLPRNILFHRFRMMRKNAA